MDAAHQPNGEKKPWGYTRRLLERPSVGMWVDHASIEAGGFSSIHQHLRTNNQFHVVFGTLDVHQFWPDASGHPDKDTRRTITIKAGESYTVPAGRWHQFEAREAVELVEIYWPSQFDIPDIQRHDTGGRA